MFYTKNNDASEWNKIIQISMETVKHYISMEKVCKDTRQGINDDSIFDIKISTEIIIKLW